VSRSRIPLTVIGGYLGAGKTTLVNRLLAEPGGRRLGVIVNDFGALAVDAGLLAAAAGEDGVVSLPNGCVCCTVGAGLHEALSALSSRAEPPDHVLIEVSGVADPATAAAWGTVPPFLPAGVIVLAAADTIRRQARDRYVGPEVVRQLAGADLLLVTKSDLVGAGEIDGVHRWLEGIAPDVPRVEAVAGDVPADVVLGVGPSGMTPPAPGERPAGHSDRYRTWTWASDSPVSIDALHRVLDDMGEVLRVKGVVRLDDGRTMLVQVVGRRRDITPAPLGLGPGFDSGHVSELVAIALADH